jgi:hypothetical protein
MHIFASEKGVYLSSNRMNARVIFTKKENPMSSVDTNHYYEPPVAAFVRGRLKISADLTAGTHFVGRISRAASAYIQAQHRTPARASPAWHTPNMTTQFVPLLH